MNDFDTITNLAMELQSIAQIGLTYTKDVYDKERFERIREISAELMAIKTGFPIEKVKELFCNETGYQTPKIETRAVIFKENRILLVKEKGKWSLPGGWVDYNESITSNTIKEAKEESGLDVKPIRIIAIQDRNKHNVPKYAYGIVKVFVLCEVLGGSFQQNNETTESNYFSLENLPILDEDKNVYEQIKMCFDAIKDNKWQVVFD
ncbi:NUDIX hydrolase [Clostridium sp.]|uniref:NUDIX hydrolase n=1 Tax=Clostridium sp. TaxID=1506 RepID=UPI0032176FE9